ncbi:vitamin B12-dependent ribonucleotide reductase [Verrucomicrobiaceae bacterium N1E253]|uniref:Vitamin B12-dependent ribonucleotide reductase n=1 Tax=Oceaniferula marina TaxID=2748318 RepID=A0A851GKB7_9BACT|nr:vitamin B12-dependent ribonucleotide reductase [Oceaniferula marina]NWK57462.1 vitamin B12-dependent ribonucleotide reductase [Oceaniferula marina]
MSVPPVTADAPKSKKSKSSGPTTPSKALSFKATFATPGICPFDDIEWSDRTAEITDDSGGIMFRQENVQVPASWSELSAKIAVSKYFYGDIAKGTDPSTGGRETSIKQLVHRVTRTIADWGLEDGYFADKESTEVFYNDLTWLCLNQYGAFNSPVWFNVGLYQEYGVGKDGGQGNWRWSDENNEAIRATTQYEYPQGSACFIQSVEDNMEDIMRLATSEAMLFKYGSGTGSDLSTLRSTREKLTGGGHPSGPLSFLRVYDQVANVVKSGGKTRRAAKMNTLKDWHPDIEEFIEAKTIEEKKAWALIEQGYDGSYNGDAYGSVMYQNENLTVRVGDEFMNAAIEGKDYWTRNVSDGDPCEKKNAREILRKIAEGTHICGDPGMQFDTTIHTWHTCKASGRQHSTNPCSEFLFLNDTACNLASLNLMRFKDADGSFDTKRFSAACKLFITAQEIIVDRASYPIKNIAENSHLFRPLGLGYANIGALIMSYGLAYDSDEARHLAGSITALMAGASYEQSADMAAARSAFPCYFNSAYPSNPNPEETSNETAMLEVIEHHRSKLDNLAPEARFANITAAARKSWDAALEKGKQFGYRNSQVTLLAPTGTIGFLMDCDTTGIEPDIALVKYKLLAGGGMLKIVNQTVAPALQYLGYSKPEITDILAHIEKYDTIEDVVDEQTGEPVCSHLKPEHLPVFDCAFKAHQGKRSLHYLGHIRMMAATQPFLSGAISKTVNLPEEATIEDIMETYIEGWKLGLKAIAIYRDGSKRSAPLNTKKTEGMGGEADKVGTSSDKDDLIAKLENSMAELAIENEKLQKKANEPVRQYMPDTRQSITHKFEVAGHEGYITVGLFDNGQPGELFVQMAKEGSTIGGLMDSMGALTSMALQYGVPLERLVKKFAYQRFEPSGFTKNPDIRNAFSLTDYVFRWMGCSFIPGYREMTSPNQGQTELPMPEIETMEKKAVNRPVPELITDTAAERKAAQATATKRVDTAIGHAYMETPCTNCGSDKVIRAGACGCCTECGTSQGCS